MRSVAGPGSSCPLQLMGQAAPGAYARSDSHWITLATHGWRDGDIDWAHTKPPCRGAFDGPSWLWLLVADSDDRVAVTQLRRVSQHILQREGQVHAELLAPRDDELVAATEEFMDAALKAGRQTAVLFRGDAEAHSGGRTLDDIAKALVPELGHSRLVLAGNKAGLWAFGGRRPHGNHGATHKTGRELELFLASQPMQCSFTFTTSQLYIDWQLGDDVALETMAAVDQYPMSAVLALEAQMPT